MPEPILVFLQQATKERNDSETKCGQYMSAGVQQYVL